MSTLGEQPNVAVEAGSKPLRTGFTSASDTETAINLLLDELRADSAAVTLVFFSPEHDAGTVAEHLDRRTGPRGVAGTTAGEVSDAAGFTHGAMTGLSLDGPGVQAAAEVIPHLDQLSLVPLEQLPEQFANRLGRDRDELTPDDHLWLLLADGVAGAEDLLTPFFVQRAPPTQLVGGSLGDDVEFEGASVVFHGRVYTNAAALILLEYDGPFELFHHQHMQFREGSFEVTGVSDQGRVLESLDGAPAAEVYADALGVSSNTLDRQLAANHPLGFRFRGRPLVCSIAGILDRGRLRMAKNVHPGDELRILEPGELVESTRDSLAQALEAFHKRHGQPGQGALFFHCLGRYLEAENDGSLDELADALDQLPHAGLNTYGEQYEAMHTNHTLTGALFG